MKYVAPLDRLMGKSELVKLFPMAAMRPNRVLVELEESRYSKVGFLLV